MGQHPAVITQRKKQGKKNVVDIHTVVRSYTSRLRYLFIYNVSCKVKKIFLNILLFIKKIIDFCFFYGKNIKEYAHTISSTIMFAHKKGNETQG